MKSVTGVPFEWFFVRSFVMFDSVMRNLFKNIFLSGKNTEIQITKPKPCRAEERQEKNRKEKKEQKRGQTET